MTASGRGVERRRRAPRETSIPVSDTPHSAQVRYGQLVRGRCRQGRRARSLPGRAAGAAGAARGALALAAFSAELSRIPQRIVHEPAMGEIRLQWWRDALAMPAATCAPAIPSPTPSARPPHSHQLPGWPAGGADRRPFAPARRRRRRSTRGWLPRFPVENRRRPVCAGRPCRGPAGQRSTLHAGCAAAGQAYGLARLLLGLPRMLAARPRSLGHRLSSTAAGLTAEDLLAGAADGQDRRRARQTALPRFAAIWTWRGNSRPACRGRRGSPSFLWPWSSLICGLSSGRARALLREETQRCAAHARVPDCRRPSVRPAVRRRCAGLGGQEREMAMRQWRSGGALRRGSS